MKALPQVFRSCWHSFLTVHSSGHLAGCVWQWELCCFCCSWLCFEVSVSAGVRTHTPQPVSAMTLMLATGRSCYRVLKERTSSGLSASAPYLYPLLFSNTQIDSPIPCKGLFSECSAKFLRICSFQNFTDAVNVTLNRLFIQTFSCPNFSRLEVDPRKPRKFGTIR